MAAKKTTKKKATKKAASKKKPTSKKAAKKSSAKAAKKAPAKKAAKKPAKKAAKKPAKKAAKKAAKKPAKKASRPAKPAKKAPATSASTKASSPAPISAEGYTLPLPKRPLDLNSLAVSYRDGDALAHPVTPEQMEQVSHDGLRGDEAIRHVDDDAAVAPCRLVDHGEGRFSLCLDDFRMPKVSFFDERGLQGGGYTWEAIADSLARLRRPEIVDGLSYDSEASMFVALGTRPTLVALAHLLQEALDDDALLRAAVDAADPDRLE